MNTNGRTAGPASAESACEIGLLGFRARATGPRAVLDELRAMYPPAPTWSTIGAGVSAAFHVKRDAPRPGWYHIVRDRTPLWATERCEELAPALEWHINNAAVERLGARFLLHHAGAVAYADRGVVLPAASGRGKTTLVAALVAAGFQYLSDEVTVLDPARLQLLPFAKSLCVKEGSARALAPYYPSLAAEAPRPRLGRGSAWYLHPPPAAWPPGPVAVRYVVLPQYSSGRC